MIVLNQIKKIFNTNSGCVTAVDSVNLSIRKGEIFGIIGYVQLKGQLPLMGKI